MPEDVVEKQPDRAAVWIFQEAEAIGGGSEVNALQERGRNLYITQSNIFIFSLYHTSGCTFLMRK